jgi:hypothetical protein
MLDKFTEKLIENAMPGYRPKLEELSKIRVDELAATKAKIRTHPEVVEAWFDTEIAKAMNIEFTDILKKIKF